MGLGYASARDKSITWSGTAPQGMTEADTMVEFVDPLSQDGISDNKLRKILANVERVVSETEMH